MATRSKRWPRPNVLLYKDRPTTTVHLEDGLDVPSVFVARWEQLPGIGSVDATIEVTRSGRACLTRLVIEGPRRTRDVGSVSLRGVPNEEIKSLALLASSFSVATPERERAASTAARRRAVDTERLERVAADYERGGIEAVKASERIGERFAWRLVKRAKAEL
jgi:hypothetical protein